AGGGGGGTLEGPAGPAPPWKGPPDGALVASLGTCDPPRWVAQVPGGACFPVAPGGGRAMRTPLLALAAVALLTSACSGSAGSSSANGGPAPQPPSYHPPPPPYPEQPAPTPYDGVTYQDPGVNPYVDPVEYGVSTFGLDVDTASYTIAQRYVDDGFRPDPASVRVEEWVNAFDQGYRAPPAHTFAVAPRGGAPTRARD